MKSEEIRALMSPVVAEIYNRGDVGLSLVDRERLQDLGFCRRSFNGAESSEIWVREIPNTFRFPGTSRFAQGMMMQDSCSGSPTICCPDRDGRPRSSGTSATPYRSAVPMASMTTPTSSTSSMIW